MDPEPSSQQPRSAFGGFDARMALLFLVALPLITLVTVVLVNALGQKQPPQEQPAAERKEKAEAADPAAVPARSPDVQERTAERIPPAERSPGPKELGSEEARGTAGQASPPGRGTRLSPPWQTALESGAEPPSYTQLAFQSFEEAFDRPDREDLTPWFERTPSAGFRINKIQTQYGKSGTIEGIGRLLCPWPADGVLRLQLDNFNRLKMHFFHGLTGVTLIYYEDQGYRWAAYATTREEGKPTPKTWAITATDDDRCRRTELRFGGPIELRYRDGELMLSRGDVVLLTAPLAGPPSQVFFEGRATIHGISLTRTKDAPREIAPRQLKVEQRGGGRESIAENISTDGQGQPAIDSRPLSLRPAELMWTATKPEIAKPEMLTDGSVRIAGDQLQQRGECFARLPIKGPTKVIVELADVSPGVGVFLSGAGGKPAEVIRLCRDRRSGQLVARLSDSDDTWEADLDSPSDKAAPLADSHCCVRLLYGCGNLRWWLSSDGMHWAQTEPALDNAAPGITSIGLQVVANCPGAGLTLKRIILQPLEGLSSLAKQELIERAPAITANSLTDWLSEAMTHKPADVDTSEWLRACTIRTLGGGARRGLAYALLEALLDDAAHRHLPLEQQLAALDDAMLMALDLRDGQATGVGSFGRYAQLGIRAADEDGVPAWTSVHDHYHAAPALTWMQMPTDLDRVIRWELVSDLYRRRPREALDLVTRLRFFQQHRDSAKGGLVDWVETMTKREVPGRAAGESIGQLRETWREPLVEELSKEAYNALTELKAVLESQAWEDAARLVTTLDPEAAPGVAPYVSDRELLTSLPVAVQLTLENYPQLRLALGQKFEALAKLRIAGAISAGDAAAIELATVQFAGTPVVADAHRWLGDRALVAGQFRRAMSQYERARQAAPEQDAEILPRVRLAAAMLGRDAGEPVASPVRFGEVSMSAAEFEALAAEMRGRGASTADDPSSARSAIVPQPSRFEAHVRSRLDGPVGERPQEEVGRRTNQLRVPWADRQLAAVVERDVMYVANRFQVAAYSVTSGQRMWQSQTPPGQMQRAQQWALIPMWPLVAGDRIFVRLLYSPSPLLACLEKSSGRLLWVSENRDHEFLVSDPLLAQGQLVALGTVIQPDQQAVLRYYTFDPQTGEILGDRDLVRLRSSWGARACCEVIEVEDGLVVVLGGVTLAVDAAGNVRWVRTHISLPVDEDPRWVLQMFQRPLIKDGRIYVAQPGVRTVECLAAATGRRYWSAVLPEVIGIVGLAGDQLVVRTETDIRGLALADGVTQWRYAADDLFSFSLVDEDRLLVARRERMSNQTDRWQTRLTWLNPADGEPIATTVLPDLADDDPRLGPLVPYKDRLFTFFGRGQHDPTRDIVELIPSGAAERVSPQLDAWHAAAASKP